MVLDTYSMFELLNETQLIPEKFLKDHLGTVTKIMNLGLCLVPVKYFLENKYFPEMLFLGKENIFKCLVAL